MPQPEIRIRTYEPRDKEAFRTLNEEWIIKHFSLEEPDRQVLDDPEGHILSPGGQIIIAEAAGEPVGCCALIPTGPGEYELAKMAVTSRLQGAGIGRRILDYTIREARAMGARSLHLGSNHVLANAIHLYESLGFRHRAPEDFPPTPYARADVFMDLELA